MSSIREQKMAGQCSGCCNNCKNKKDEHKVNLLRSGDQANKTRQDK